MTQSTAELPLGAHLDVTIVIVNFNVRYFLEQCLYSVRVAAQGLTAEIIVVDNASKDDSLAYLSTQPDVRTVANPINVGFAKANNQAIREARGRYILLLNPDTLVEPETFKRCLALADAEPKIGVIGARMVDGTGRFLPESKRGLPTPWVSFTKMTGLSRLAPRSERFNGYYLGHLEENVISEIDVLPGAFMWLRREALEAVGGGLDEDYFMYGEDIDLSYLIQQAGFQVIYNPQVQIVHYKGESTRKRSWHYVKAFYRAMAIFSRKHLSGTRTAQQPILEAVIYLRAGLAVIFNAFAKTLPALLDAALLVASLLLVKEAWARFYFDDAAYYDDSAFNLVNLPLYVGLWLFGLTVSGAYDKPYRLWTMARGMALGSMFVLLIYALLPAALHTSRAVVLLTAAVGVIVLGLLRLAWSTVRPGEVSISRASIGRERRLVIVGSAAESDRALTMLARVGIARDYLGRVSPKPEETSTVTLGTTGNLEEIAGAYRVDELIICLADVPVDVLIDWMARLGPTISYRTLAPHAAAIVGSPSRDTPGELYALRRGYNLAEPRAGRSKRLFDFGLAALTLGCFPIVLFAQAPLGMLRNALLVLIGQLTWVGYGRQGGIAENLPRLRPCVLGQEGLSQNFTQDAGIPRHRSTQRSNEVYARYWRLSDEFKTVWQNRGALGRDPLALTRLSPPRWPHTWVSVKT